MIQGIDINQRIEFSLKRDITDPKTIFVLKPLSGLQMMEFSEGSKNDLLNMLIKSIVEVKNFSNPALSIEDIINSLDINSIGELMNKVNEVNQITRQDEKN